MFNRKTKTSSILEPGDRSSLIQNSGKLSAESATGTHSALVYITSDISWFEIMPRANFKGVKDTYKGYLEEMDGDWQTTEFNQRTIVDGPRYPFEITQSSIIANQTLDQDTDEQIQFVKNISYSSNILEDGSINEQQYIKTNGISGESELYIEINIVPKFNENNGNLPGPLNWEPSSVSYTIYDLKNQKYAEVKIIDGELESDRDLEFKNIPELFPGYRETLILGIRQNIEVLEQAVFSDIQETYNVDLNQYPELFGNDDRGEAQNRQKDVQDYRGEIDPAAFQQSVEKITGENFQGTTPLKPKEEELGLKKM